MPPHVANLVSYGVPFRLQADTPDLLDQALRLTPHSTFSNPSAPFNQETFPVTEPTLPSLREALMVHVANLAPDYVFLHAGVVAIDDRALVLPGPSFAGKTTLTAALVCLGATYYSDEYAVLTPAGLIHPYARDLQVRLPGRQVQIPTPIERLNGHAGIAPIPAALIAFVEYIPSAVWAPTPVTPGMAVLEMLRHTIPVQRTPARVLSTLTTLVAPARILRSPRDEAESCARNLLALLERPA